MRIVVLMVFLVLASGVVHAVQVDGLYKTFEHVQTQGATERKAAIRQAINRVAQKVTGRADVLHHGRLQNALSNVDAYVEQFQYSKLDEGIATGYRLEVTFQKAALDRVLQQFDMPIWGSNRPAVVVWLAVESGSKRYLVGEGTSKTAALIQKVAKQTGLPVILPLLDLEDQRALEFNDVWGMFSERIVQASTRYGAKHVLFGRLLKEQGNGWKIRWSFINDQSQFDGESRQQLLTAALRESLSASADVLAGIYAPRGNTFASDVMLDVVGISNLKDFSHISKYLASLDAVSQVNWSQVRPNKASFVLKLTADVQGLKEQIALSTVLEAAPSPEPRLPIGGSVQTTVAQPLIEPRLTLYYRAR
ncbi:MAG: hypothetical protein COB89_01945 [Piscirickettsiaceae bacterium]|nr:MAG: hypothetical protein COB89_06825 [Piscirickettsiaceae bacterium]PCH85607.1 MAG: hypothetical protein COB89_01945 [Piscirickettsiaceae bacterium]